MRNRILAVICATLVAIAPTGCSSHVEVSSASKTFSFAGTSWQVTDGEWSVNGETLNGSGGHLATTEEFTDGSIDVDVEAPAMGDRTVGIGFHITGSEGQNGYAFNFTAIRTYNLFKGTANNWQPINPQMTTFHQTDTLQPNQNHVHVEMAGNRYRVWVNGQELGDFQDASHTKGRFNLWVESSGWTVKFSNLRIKPGPV